MKSKFAAALLTAGIKAIADVIRDAIERRRAAHAAAVEAKAKIDRDHVERRDLSKDPREKP